MSKRIFVERLYSLGDYKNIKFGMEETELPDDVDVEAHYKEITALIEKAFMDYKLMAEELRSKETLEEAYDFINSYIASSTKTVKEE